jgi:cobalt-zinc-cadmium efflux system outer membrane protein
MEIRHVRDRSRRGECVVTDCFARARSSVRLAFVLAVAAVSSLRAAPVSAQNEPIPKELSLDVAVRLALDRNPTVAAAASAVEATEGQRLDVSRRLNPAVTVEGGNYPLFEASRPTFFDNQELTVRVDQEIETAGRRRLRTEAAESSVAAARSMLENERRQLTLETERAYFDVVLAKANLGIARTTLAEIDRVISLNVARRDEGTVSGVEVRRLQVERLKFVDDAFAAQLALRNAKAALLAIFSAPDLTLDFDVTEPLAAPATTAPIAAPGALQAAAAGARPDLEAARHELQRADTETRLQRALRSPNITVGGGYVRDFGANAVVFGVTVPLQIFNRNQGGVVRADAERRRVAQLAEAAATAVRLDVQQARNSLEVSAARVEYIEREYLGNARQTRDTVLASYRLGAADLIDYLDAQRSFRDTVRTHNQALYELRVSQFQLAAAVGRPLSGGQE